MARLTQILTLLGILTFAGVSLGQGDARNRLLKTGITKPDLPWVDAPGIFGSGISNGTKVDGGGSAVLKNGGKGSGKGTGTEFTKPGAGSGSGSGGGAGGGDNKNGGGGGNGEMMTMSTPGGSSAKPHPRFYPMCLFMDPSVSTEEGNKTIKGLVDDAATCQVTLVVFPFTIKSNYPDDPNVINAAQSAMCNISTSGIAPAGSTSTCVKYDQTADKMCGDYDSKIEFAGGCAESRAARGFEVAMSKEERDRAEAQNGKEGLGKGSVGGMASSIEDAGNCSSGTVGHEALGHSQFGHPNGASDGNGIGLSETGGGEGWTGAGCVAMFGNAFENDGRWTYDPQRVTYYTKPKNEEAWKDLMNPEPIFKQQKQFAQQAQPLQITTPPGQRITMSDEPKAQNPAKVPPAQPEKGKAQMEDGQDGRHRKLGTALSQLLGGKKEEVVDGEPELEKPGKFSANPKAPPNFPGKPPGPRIGFDDAAPKGRSFKGGGATVTSVEGPPSGSYGESSDAPGEVGPGVSQGASMTPSGGNYAGGSGSGATIGYDDNAPKGGLNAGSFYGGDRSPASVGSDSANRIGGVVRAGAGSWRSSQTDEEEFFEEVGEDGQPVPRKKKEVRRRGSAVREPGSLRGKRVNPLP